MAQEVAARVKVRSIPMLDNLLLRLLLPIESCSSHLDGGHASPPNPSRGEAIWCDAANWPNSYQLTLSQPQKLLLQALM